MRTLFAAFVLILAAGSAWAGGRSITYFLDGARVDGEVSAAKGYLEIPLSSSTVPDSLRVRPLGGNAIVRVEIEAARPNPKLEKEVAALGERRTRLEDRLRALDSREDIFKAAAKSQSSKAPRKTKTNPEPMETIRKGTEYAVAQLEEVYRARRKAEEGIKAVDARLAALKKEGAIGGSIARVWLSGKGKVGYSYLLADTKWSPCYDFRLDGKGEVEVVQRAHLPKVEKGETVAVVPATLAGAVDLPPRGVADRVSEVSRFRFPVVKEESASSPLVAVSFSFRNAGKEKLLPGDAAVYRQGEYLGTVRFSGSAPGDTNEIVAGGLQQPAQSAASAKAN